MKKTKKLSAISRLLLLAGAVLLGISALFPWWGLDLEAPQYPEGLAIIVYPFKLVGELDIINNLNHYIGMAEITQSGFPELQYIPYIIWGMVALTVVTAVLGNKKLAYIVCLLFVVGGALGMYDMYRWLHTFGTQLSADAPIKVPPFVPPVVGKNQLANFTTYSSFRSGFYFLVFSAIAVFLGTWGGKLWAKKSA